MSLLWKTSVWKFFVSCGKGFYTPCRMKLQKTVVQFSKEQMQERLWVILESQAYTALFASSRESLQTHCWPYAEKWWLPVIFPRQKTSCKTQLGTVSPATYIKCSVGWNSSPHMLKRQPWTRESSVLYSAHNGNYTASLHKDQWWLVQKAIHLLKKVLGHEPWVQVFPTWKLLCTLSCHSASGKMLKWTCMHQKHVMKM